MAGKEANYTYTPGNGITLPDSIKAYIVNCTPKYNIAAVPLAKNGNSYTFSYTAADSTPVLAICIAATGNNAVIDNNKGQMFTMPLYDKQDKLATNITAETAYLLSDYIRYIFRLNFTQGFIPGMYTTAFKQHPEQKDKYYLSYLFAMAYDYGKDGAGPLIKAYNKKVLAENKNETDWHLAYNLCKAAKMDDEAAAMQQKIITAFPKGETAKNTFLSNLEKQDENTVNLVAAMQEYMARFGDSSQQVKNKFYGMIVSAAVNTNDWANVNKYEALITDRQNAAWQLNSLAATLAGDSTKLPHAAGLARRAVQTAGENLSAGNLAPDEKERWQGAYDRYASTYALILYKQGNLDSACYYESAIANKNNIDEGGREILATCIEKLQGAEAARQYIEKQLLQGSTSALLQQQLQLIYTRLNLPQAAYDKITANAKAAIKAKAKKEIVDILGSTQAKNFTLKDLAGNTVTLASLRNKVVVLDFWATWCGPCKASFPAMQQAVTNYKDDKDVVFLFIDVWEKGDKSNIRKNAAKFIKDNNYTFRVLVDDESKVPPIYKLGGIPTKFIIDKQGNIAHMFIGNYINDLAGAIEEAKKQDM